jgi:hypothetical protein
MKKEVSDHLAHVFLETRPAQKQKKEKSFFYFLALSPGLITVFILGLTLWPRFAPRVLVLKNEALRLERRDGPYHLRFDFSQSAGNPAALDIEMPDADLRRYKKIAFLARLRDAGAHRLGTLKVSLVNKRKETSSRYISEVDSSWKKIVVPFSAFGNIQDWSHLSFLTFTLEPWNALSKKGELLIDDIQFLMN